MKLILDAHTLQKNCIPPKKLQARFSLVNGQSVSPNSLFLTEHTQNPPSAPLPPIGTIQHRLSQENGGAPTTRTS